jgi:hypothetical protein
MSSWSRRHALQFALVRIKQCIEPAAWSPGRGRLMQCGATRTVPRRQVHALSLLLHTDSRADDYKVADSTAPGWHL